MKYFRNIVIAFICFLPLFSCGSLSKKNVLLNENRGIEIHGLTLKYVLLDTAAEIYQVNVEKEDPFIESVYKEFPGTDTYQHFLWMRNTYASFPEEMKDNLKIIYENTSDWYYMNEVSSLSDTATCDEIITTLTHSAGLIYDHKKKNAIQSFFPYFYHSFLKEYIEYNTDCFTTKVTFLSTQVAEKNADIFQYMENISGIPFRKVYQPVFYFTLRPIGANGFVSGNRKISTIQRTVSDYSNLLGTPFHEYSHELFRTFTQKSAFKTKAKSLKSNIELWKLWKTGMPYDWNGWCEENLVEGFSKYLEFSYYGNTNETAIYLYDLAFYYYLKEINFNAKEQTLEKVCIDFYSQI